MSEQTEYWQSETINEVSENIHFEERKQRKQAINQLIKLLTKIYYKSVLSQSISLFFFFL